MLESKNNIFLSIILGLNIYDGTFFLPTGLEIINTALRLKDLIINNLPDINNTIFDSILKITKLIWSRMSPESRDLLLSSTSKILIVIGIVIILYCIIKNSTLPLWLGVFLDFFGKPIGWLYPNGGSWMPGPINNNPGNGKPKKPIVEPDVKPNGPPKPKGGPVSDPGMPKKN
jgi:hypothetical protein